jgi:uncharacterized protein
VRLGSGPGKVNRAFVWLGLLLALLAAPAAALELPPRPQGPIYDEADLLPAAQETVLDQRLRDFNATTGDAVIVATVNSLQGETIERYATQLYETWGIGGAERDTGVLLLVAPNQKKVRIEVGYGLTPYITDILSGRIIRNDITPRFRAGDMAGGIEAGVDAMLTQLSKSPEDAKAIAEAAAAAQKNRPRGEGGFPVGALLWVGFILFFVFLPLLGRRRGRHYRGSGVGSTVGNILLWTALNSAMNSGRHGGGWGGGGGGFGGGGGGGFGGFGGGRSGGGGASGGR